MKKAKELGLKVVINPDAHHLEGLEDVAYGVGIARKGWLTREDVFNTGEAKDVADYLEKRRRKIKGWLKRAGITTNPFILV